VLPTIILVLKSEMCGDIVPLLVLAAGLIPGHLARPGHLIRPEVYRAGQDMILRARDHGFQDPGQGDCSNGWKDGSSVGLGCVLADLNDGNVDKPDAVVACRDFGEDGRLIEIYNEEQMTFLQNLLALVESAYLPELGGEVYWWIALNDVAAEGEYVWPVGGSANYTNWNVDYGEPFPDPNHEANCVEMMSAQYFSLQWVTYYCDDSDNVFPVCQISL